MLFQTPYFLLLHMLSFLQALGSFAGDGGGTPNL